MDKFNLFFNSMDTYVVYKNDLKYRKFRDIDSKNIECANEDTERLFDDIQNNKIDTDTIDYRVNECVRNNYYDIDLNHLNLSHLPKLPDDLKKNLKCLFIFDNNLTEIDLSGFKNLEILDISNNNINSIKNIPDTLEELFCKNNKLSDLPDMKNIRRVNCSFNSIQSIKNNYPNLTILDCSNNSIHKIQNIVSLKKLFASNNQITKIPNFKNLDFLDISNNRIDTIDLNSIRELIVKVAL
jgi:Leucine-rich repeat (LRR) protein